MDQALKNYWNYLKTIDLGGNDADPKTLTSSYPVKKELAKHKSLNMEVLT